VLVPVETPDNLPEEVAVLGTPVAVFKGRRIHAFLYFVLGIGGLIGGVAGGLYLLAAFLGLPFGLGVRNSPEDIIWALCCLLGIGGAVYSIHRARRTGGTRVFVFPDGLARVEGGKAELVYWDEIRVVRWDTQSRRTEHTITTPVQLVVVQEDGPALVFTESVSRLQELRRLIEERTLPHLLRAALQGVQAGQTISFGVVRVNKEGIHDPGGSLPWDGLALAEVDKGRLLLREVGGRRPFATFTRSQVPNLHLLVALAEHLRTNSV
jgi:hypothetical protein